MKGIGRLSQEIMDICPDDAEHEPLAFQTFNINVSPFVAKKLAIIKDTYDISMTDVVRHALGLENWFFETIQRGGKICVEKHGELFEVNYPFKKMEHETKTKKLIQV